MNEEPFDYTDIAVDLFVNPNPMVQELGTWNLDADASALTDLVSVLLSGVLS